MIWLSFLVNLVVAVPLLVALARDTPTMAVVFGGDSPARRTLAAFCAAVAAASATALCWPDKAAEVAHTLFPLQIGHALLLWPMLGLGQPIVQATLALAALHAVTMVSLYL